MVFTLTRLWRYLNIYFLKPFDAVNDTVTASLLHKLDWSGDFLEIGSGDGAFSYIMHGGSFPLSFDRYLQADMSLEGDVYDHHIEDAIAAKRVLTEPRIIWAVDRKLNHTKKIAEIGFVDQAIVAAYESLPYRDKQFDSIFFYTPHCLQSHSLAISEAYRVLKPGGMCLILVYNSAFNKDFLAYRLGMMKNNRLGKYLLSLDAGRHDELTAMSRTNCEWKQYFWEVGFKSVRMEQGLSSLGWKVYDIQTRPILKLLIRAFNSLPGPIRTTVKLAWLLIIYPLILLFYMFASNRLIKLGDHDCYFAYELSKR